MRVMVTGGAGFIGSRLVGRLLVAKDEVLVVDDFSLGTRAHLAPYQGKPNLKVLEADVCSEAFLSATLEFRPERVFHLAANSDIQAGTKDTRTDLTRTFLTTFHTLDAMRRAGSKELVFASTSAIYGEVPGALKEDHGPLQPISLYGASKLASEAYVSAFCHLYGLKAWQFRFPNVVGPNLSHGAVFDFVRRLTKDRTHLDILGNGTQTKPYLHVDDLLDAILLGVQKAQPSPLATFNVSGEGATSVREIAEIVREECGLPNAELRFGTGDRGWPGDVPRFEYDTSRIRALGWKPRLSSTEAVRAAARAEVQQAHS